MSKCIWYISKYVTVPLKGSAGARGYLLMREMARLGNRSVIITSDSNQLADVPKLDSAFQIEDTDGVLMVWVRTMKYAVAKSARRILSWVDFEWRLWRLPTQRLPKPDAIIVSSLSLLTVINGLLLKARYRCPLVLEIRDIWPLTIVEEGGFSRINPLVLGLGMIERLGYRRADAIVGTMPNLAEHVAEVVGKPRPTYCIPMGVERATLDVVEPLPPGYAETYIPKGKFIVAHAGTIGITNALDTFLECAVSMQQEADIHFLVVGEGDLRAAYMEKYGHLPNLTFAPRVSKGQVQAVLACCDLLYFSVHVSKVWKYGQSLNKIIDYMLAGKPIVASYTGFPSMINEAGCGTYVPAGDLPSLRDEVRRYHAMPRADRESLGRRGRDWILQHRTYDQLAQDYLDILFGTNAGAKQ